MIASAWHAVVEPWTVGPVLRAFVQVALLAAVGGALGCWVVFGALSYSAESLSHAMFPGLVVAALGGTPLLMGGGAGVLVAALGIAVVSRAPRIGRDAAVATVISALFGLGVLLALSPASPPGVASLLFGNLLGLSSGDLLAGAALAVGVLAALRLLHGQLLVVGFDRSGSRTLGANPALVDAALLVLLGAAVLVSVQAVGNLLTPAVLVGPAASARLLTRRIVPMMAAATGLGVVAGVGGIYLSYYAGTAAGASVAGNIVGLYIALRVIRGQPRVGTVRSSR